MIISSDTQTEFSSHPLPQFSQNTKEPSLQTVRLRLARQSSICTYSVNALLLPNPNKFPILTDIHDSSPLPRYS